MPALSISPPQTHGSAVYTSQPDVINQPLHACFIINSDHRRAALGNAAVRLCVQLNYSNIDTLVRGLKLSAVGRNFVEDPRDVNCFDSHFEQQQETLYRWLGSRVVSVLDSGAERPGFKSQPRRYWVTVLGKLFTPIVPLFTKQRNW